MKKIPPFTVILLMAVLAVTGIAGIPLLNVQYSPVPADKSITVSYSWGEASERVMETEVTSRLEGVLTGIRNCSSVSSVSDRGSGSVTLKFRKGTDMAAARFEVASRIRNAYPSLPDGVSYPSISLGTRGAGSRTALTYVFKSPLPSLEIERYVTGHVTVPLPQWTVWTRSRFGALLLSSWKSFSIPMRRLYAESLPIWFLRHSAHGFPWKCSAWRLLMPVR